MSRRVAAIDIGSNSIKLLVAEKNAQGRVAPVFTAIEETRLGGHFTGKDGTGSCIPPDRMAAAVRSVEVLLEKARAFEPGMVRIAATSAVRDAENRDELCEIVFSRTGFRIEVLTGEDEARLIGLGVRQEPLLEGVEDVLLADLGGGSLELLEFSKGNPAQAVSLPLGSVRMMRAYVADPAAPMEEAVFETIAQHARKVLDAAPFRRESHPVIAGLGGGLTVVRQILAACAGVSMEAFGQRIPVTELRDLAAKLRPLDLTQRKAFPGMNPARADVILPALAVLLAVAEVFSCREYLQSHCNLRFGLAAEMLGLGCSK